MDSPSYVRKVALAIEFHASVVHGALVRQDLLAAARLLKAYADALERS
jgi:hypothetical protein